MTIDLRPVLAFSQYASRAVTADPALVPWLEAAGAHPFPWQEARAGLAAAVDPDTLAPALRHLRRRVFLHTMARDLAGLAPLQEVGAAMTRLAETALQAAVEVVELMMALEEMVLAVAEHRVTVQLLVLEALVLMAE